MFKDVGSVLMKEVKQTIALGADDLADLERIKMRNRRMAHIRITKDGASWTRAGGGWRRVNNVEARDGD